MGVGQLICFVVGVLLLSLGGGLAGGRWALQRQGVSTPENAIEAPARLEEPHAAEPPAASKNAPAQKAVEDNRQTLSPPRPSQREGATETAAKPSAGKSSGTVVSKYVIQAISTSSRADARNARRKIMAEGFPAGIFEVDLGEKGRWYRVYVGPYDTEAEVRVALESVRTIPGFKASFVKPLE